MSQPCVLVVADPERIAELVAALSEPLPGGPIDVVISSGGDDTLDLFAARKPTVAVVTASLDAGDSKSLIDALRASVPRAEISIVVVGDDHGPIRTALDAMDLEPDRFVNRPLSPKALRYAVASAVEAVALVKRSTTDVGLTAEPVRPPAPTPPGPSGSTLVGLAVPTPTRVDDEPTASTRATLRARWSALADSMDHAAAADDRAPLGEAPAEPVPDDHDQPALPPPPALAPAPVQSWSPGTTSELDGEWPHEDSAAGADAAPAREHTLILREDPSLRLDPMSHPTDLIGGGVARADVRADLRAGHLAGHRRPTEPPILRADTRRPTEPQPQGPRPERRRPTDPTDPTDPLGPPLPFPDRRRVSAGPPLARTPTEDRWPVPTGVTPAQRAQRLSDDSPAGIVLPRTHTLDDMGEQAPDAMDSVIVAERSLNEDWSAPQALPAIGERESRRDIHPASVDELGLDDFDDDLVVRDDAGGLGALGELSSPGPSSPTTPRATPAVIDRAERLDRPPERLPERPPALDDARPERSADDRIGGRDFARQLRAKMSQMAQRLFQGAEDAAPPAATDHTPRHDHHTEIDLAALGEEQVLGQPGVTEIEVRTAARPDEIRPVTSPGSWDTAVRERGMADAGELVRGVSDVAMLLAKLFAQRSTGRVAFRRAEAGVAAEKIVFFDQGRPVFASSNAAADRMGELLVREGKITASQYERCQTHVAESGRRMGEILVDFGYLKRRELLPAVRRHVEDIIYSLFGWDHGAYAVALEPTPSAERIRLSRHPASLILEGIRRKLDRTTLEKLVGSATTVIELGDRERLGGIINLGDLAGEERAALAAFDGQADLAAVARTAGVDVADVLPLAWGLVVLGLATARRTETEVPDESGALVGETDLAIDRERVRARWQLVTDADYFALLGVRRDATAFEIRRAYQGARRDFAADCFPSDLRRELAQELQDIAHVLDEAFRVLRDDRLRLTYLHNLVE